METKLVMKAVLDWLLVLFMAVMIGGVVLEYAGRQARRVWKAWTTDPDEDLMNAKPAVDTNVMPSNCGSCGAYLPAGTAKWAPTNSWLCPRCKAQTV